MSERDRLDELEEGLNAFGEETGNSNDPLAEIEDTFTNVDKDPFDLYMLDSRHQNLTEASYNHWVRAFDQWRDFMEAQGRHPACPNKFHVERFVKFQLEELDNTEGDVKKKLFYVNAAYEWMQAEGVFKTPVDFNPFKRWLKKGVLDTSNSERNYPRVSLEELRGLVDTVRNIRERAIMVTHLKTGARSQEVANIRLRDINIKHPEARNHYEQIGSHHRNEEYLNSVFIPSNREGNKREVDTILPLDEETRQVIVDWLLIRPDNGKEALFFSDKGKQLHRSDIYYLWKKHWWPKYETDEEDELDSITPHWARHHFTSWWSNEDIPRVQRKYMRGDKTDEFNRQRSAMDRYIHGYYEDIEDTYREQIFQLRLDMV